MAPAQWTEEARKLLKGRTIKDAGYVEDAGWGFALRLVLDDEVEVYVSSDDEGNEAGALHFFTPSGSETTLPRLR